MEVLNFAGTVRFFRIQKQYCEQEIRHERRGACCVHGFVGLRE